MLSMRSLPDAMRKKMTERAVFLIGTANPEDLRKPRWDPCLRKEVRMIEREVHVGDVVVFHNSKGKAHNALVNCVFDRGGRSEPATINIVHVSGDEDRQDSYGRQIERPTSVPHISATGVHGMCWRYQDEPAPVYVEPTEV